MFRFLKISTLRGGVRWIDVGNRVSAGFVTDALASEPLMLYSGEVFEFVLYDGSN